MARALILVLDSFGCGAAEDAASYGDEGADTLGHIASACAAGLGDRAGLRKGPLRLPNLDALGLGLLAEASTGHLPPGLSRADSPKGLWGYGVETSLGKDTPSGHWEMAGAPVHFTWGYFPQGVPAFPAALTDALIAEGGLPGILGNCHAPGVEIIEELGEESRLIGSPICYTSVDSVLQIAAHEESFGRQRLYDLCVIARRLCNPLNIGRVIARPFVGTAQTGFKRTAYRKDFALLPPPGNLLHRAAEAGRKIVSIGKTGDIFAHQHTGEEIKAANDMAHFDAMLSALKTLPDGGLIFANFVDLDSEFGHRRDVPGYAHGLERFDARLPELFGAMRAGDMAVLSADHGNDPTFRGTDHTREHVPILGFGPGIAGGRIGRCTSFADIGASVAQHLSLPATAFGQAWQARIS